MKEKGMARNLLGEWFFVRSSFTIRFLCCPLYIHRPFKVECLTEVQRGLLRDGIQRFAAGRKQSLRDGGGLVPNFEGCVG